jgi:hypothetical protein
MACRYAAIDQAAMRRYPLHYIIDHFLDNVGQM